MERLLTARSGFIKGASRVLRERPLIIGRARICDIVIEDRSVSRRHFRVLRKGNQARLFDLGSWKYPIVSTGDEFCIGSAIFLIATSNPTFDTSGFRKDLYSEVEGDHIAHVLDSQRRDITKSFRTLGISRSTLYLKIFGHGLRNE